MAPRKKSSAKTKGKEVQKSAQGKSTKSKRTSKKPKKGEVKKDQAFRRSLFYAICIFVSYQLMMVPLQAKAYAFFWIVSAVGFTVVISELLYSRVTQKQQSIELDIKRVRTRRWQEHFFHHLILPSLLYISGVLFLFFNKIRVLDQVAILILTGTFFVLFYNISTTYLKVYSVSRKTRYVFDFINIIVFYFVMDVLINLVFYEGIGQWMIVLGAVVVTMLLLGMMILIARQRSTVILWILVATLFLVGVGVYLVLLVPLFSITVLPVVMTVIFYLVNVYWHHKLDGTFSWNTMAQYLLYALMAVILLLYL